MTPGSSAESGSTQQRRAADGNTQIALIWVLSSGGVRSAPTKQNGGSARVLPDHLHHFAWCLVVETDSKA
jgi:hypothetical protein